MDSEIVLNNVVATWFCIAMIQLYVYIYMRKHNQQ